MKKKIKRAIRPIDMINEVGREDFYFEYLEILDGNSRLENKYQRMIVDYVNTHEEEFRNI